MPKTKPLFLVFFCIGLAVLSFPPASDGEERWKLIFRDDTQGVTWHIDSRIFFDLPGGNIRVWVKEHYPRFYYESLREIDCQNYYYRFIGCTRYSLDRKAEGPCFTPGMYTSWMVIEAGTYEDDLHAAVCGRPASSDTGDSSTRFDQTEEAPADEPYR